VVPPDARLDVKIFSEIFYIFVTGAKEVAGYVYIIKKEF
jgi:hypothetical protein